MLDDFQDEDPVKNSEFLDEFRQRLNSQPIENIEDRKKDISRSQHIFLGSVLGVGLAGVASWFILSPEYDQTQNTEIPIVRRTNTAIKVQPANPGGMEIPNQDKTVYNIVEKNDTESLKAENILPLPEEPALPKAVEDIQAKADEAVNKSDEAIKVAEKIIAKEDQKNFLSDEQKKEIKVEIINEEKKSVAINDKTVSDTKPEQEAVAVQAPSKPIEKNVTQPEPKSEKITSGMWQIQLISSPNKSAMEKSWNDLIKKYDALKGLPHEIESADLGIKGTFYRLKAGAFNTRTNADKICNSIKSAGGSCLVKKKQ